MSLQADKSVFTQLFERFQRRPFHTSAIVAFAGLVTTRILLFRRWKHLDLVPTRLWQHMTAITGMGLVFQHWRDNEMLFFKQEIPPEYREAYRAYQESLRKEGKASDPSLRDR